MKILDRYIISRFLIALIAGTAVFVFIFIIVDMTDNMSGYLESGRGSMEIFNIYLTQIPSLIMLLFPVGSIVALFYSIGVMVRNNEFMAVKATGISAYRFLIPLYILILILSIGLFIFNETVVVKANKLNREIKNKKKFEIEFARNINIIQDKTTIINASMYSSKEHSLKMVNIFTFNENNRLTEKIEAKEIFWNNSQWHIKEGIRIEYTENIPKKTLIKSGTFDKLKIKPSDILIDRENIDIYSIGSLMKNIETIRESGYDYKKQSTEIMYRYSYIFITLIIIIIGSTFVIGIKTRGILFGLSMSIFLSFLYWGILQGFRSSGANGYMTALMAMLIPNTFFFILSIILLMKARK